MIAHPGLPQIRSGRAQLTHPARDGRRDAADETAAPLGAIRRGYGDKERSHNVLPLVPPAGSARRQRPSLDWVRRDAFPSFDGTMALSDSLRPSRRAWLPSPGDTLRCVCRFAPVGPDTRPRAWGSSFRSPPPESVRREAVRASQVPVQPTVPMPCSSTPAGPKTPGPCGASARPPLCPRRRLPRIYPAFEAQSHGLGTCCLRFARRVTTADAKLASGCRPSSTGRDWLPAGLLRKVSDDVILLSRAFLAQGHSRMAFS